MVLAGALAVAMAPSIAAAQSGDPAQAAADGDGGKADEDVGAGEARSAAPDKLTNHVLLHGDVGGAFSTGSLANNLAFSDRVGAGLSFGGGLGLGLSRYLALDVSASYAMLSGSTLCPDCSGRSLDVGVGFAYHVAQGFAIDPWISLGVGYRSATFTGTLSDFASTPIDEAFRGLDLARIGLGGEFFPLPWLGMGPTLQLSVGTTISQPDPDQTAGIYTIFQVGFRIELDPVGRRSRAPATLTGASGGSETGRAPGSGRTSWGAF